MSPADSPFAPLPAPGPHPATAELRAYAAGTLAPADEHRIEAHTLDCERCADLVEGFSMSDAAATDHAVAELRTRLQARIGAAETLEPVAAPWAWPRLAAAAALLGVVGGGIWAWEQHDTAPQATVARLETTAPTTPAAPKTAPAAASATANAAAETEVAIAPAPAPAAKPAANTADYAAVSPSRSARMAARRQDYRVNETLADGIVLKDDAEAPPIVAEAEVPAAAPPMASAAPARAGAAAPTPAPSEVVLAEATIMADTMADDKADKKKKSSFDKANTFINGRTADNAAAARVPATPMPAAPTVNAAPVVGGIAFREYLRREAAGFDPEINNLRLSGTVRVRFIVEADGKLSNLKVTRGLRKDYDDEALRIVCEGPAWQPGIAGGKRAPLPIEVTVPF